MVTCSGLYNHHRIARTIDNPNFLESSITKNNEVTDKNFIKSIAPATEMLIISMRIVVYA